MAAAISFTHAADSSAGSTSSLSVSAGVGAAAADRYVLVGLNLGNDRVLGAMTIGGVTATKVFTPSVANSITFFLALVPTGTTATVAISWTGGNSLWAITVYRLTGISATPFDALEGTVADPSVALLDIPEGGVAAAMARAITSTAFTWTGLTEDVDDATGAVKYSSAGGTNTFVSAETDFSITADTDVVARMCAISFSPPQALILGADVASFTLTGVAASFGIRMPAGASVFSLTGQVADLVAPSFILLVDAAVFVFTGVGAGLSAVRRMTAAAAAFTFTGIVATLERTQQLAAETGVFVLSGLEAAIARARLGTRRIMALAAVNVGSALRGLSGPRRLGKTRETGALLGSRRSSSPRLLK